MASQLARVVILRFRDWRDMRNVVRVETFVQSGAYVGALDHCH